MVKYPSDLAAHKRSAEINLQQNQRNCITATSGVLLFFFGIFPGKKTSFLNSAKCNLTYLTTLNKFAHWFWRLLLLQFIVLACSRLQAVHRLKIPQATRARYFTELSVFGVFGLLRFCWAFLSLPSLPVVSVFLCFGVRVCGMSYLLFFH